MRIKALNPFQPMPTRPAPGPQNTSQKHPCGHKILLIMIVQLLITKIRMIITLMVIMIIIVVRPYTFAATLGFEARANRRPEVVTIVTRPSPRWAWQAFTSLSSCYGTEPVVPEDVTDIMFPYKMHLFKHALQKGCRFKCRGPRNQEVLKDC